MVYATDASVCRIVVLLLKGSVHASIIPLVVCCRILRMPSFDIVGVDFDAYFVGGLAIMAT